jgi:Ariadne domain
MQNWSVHGYSTCNRFESGEVDATETDAARAKHALARYLHYYNRYHAHHQAQMFAQKQLKETEVRMVQLLESTATTWIDVEFLKAANLQLVECRRVLKYTYIFGFYLDNVAEEAATSMKKNATASATNRTATPRRKRGRGMLNPFRSSSPSSVPAATGLAESDAASNISASARTKLARERFEHHQEMLERFTETLSESSEKPEDQMNRVDIVNQTRAVDKFMKNILQYVNENAF